MADQEIATISQKLQEVKGKFQSIRENGERYQGAIKASQLKPLYLLGDVLEKMGPLTAYVVADGDVTKAEMVDKAQNEHIRTLIKPVQDAFASANGRYEDAGKLTRDTQISATEDLKKLEEWEKEVRVYDDRLKTLRNESTNRRTHILADLKTYKAQHEELMDKQKELEARRGNDEKVLHPPDDEPWWERLGWGLAGWGAVGYLILAREMTEQAARHDQKAIDDQMEVNGRQIDKTETLIKQEDDALAAANDRLDKIEQLTKKMPETINDTKAIINQCNEDISALDKVSEGMGNMFPLLDDATAEAKAGFRIAYRENFAETILTITTQLPMDERVKEQIALLLDALTALPKDCELYAKLQPQLEIARMRIGQQAIKSA